MIGRAVLHQCDAPSDVSGPGRDSPHPKKGHNTDDEKEGASKQAVGRATIVFGSSDDSQTEGAGDVANMVSREAVMRFRYGARAGSAGHHPLPCQNSTFFSLSPGRGHHFLLAEPNRMKRTFKRLSFADVEHFHERRSSRAHALRIT